MAIFCLYTLVGLKNLLTPTNIIDKQIGSGNTLNAFENLAKQPDMNSTVIKITFVALNMVYLVWLMSIVSIYNNDIVYKFNIEHIQIFFLILFIFKTIDIIINNIYLVRFFKYYESK